MLGDKNIRFVESNLQHLREQNSKLCKEVKSLPELLMQSCYLIGATKSDGRLQVKVSKTHLDLEVFSREDVNQCGEPLSQEQMMGIFPVSEGDIPGISPLLDGNSLWIVKCKLPHEVLQRNPTLRDLVCSSRMIFGDRITVTFDARIRLYCLVKPEDCEYFFQKVHKESLGYKYKCIPNFLHKVQLLYVRVRGTQEDKKISELCALKDIVGLKADFFVRDERKVLGKKRWWVTRSISGGDNPPLGAEGGVLISSGNDLPLGADGEVSRSKEKTGRQQAEVVSTMLQNLSICLERAISKDEDLSRSSSRK
ncbi:DUF3023 domain-containing protein [Ehrlichia japonica]|uniref:Uncharacterized protein n=1 Tax=Ehrlichia japonica TaxID=391036 RepID=X5H3P6_9RICK|nr:DUF3023 domain-containing protein [Ehrlichia japonica]AHX04700.1 hypothetical protein EHF_0623 [Ehrlichia japonica]